MGVIMMDEGPNPIESYLQQWMQRKQQDEMQQRQLAQQQSQFEQSLALDKQRTDATTGMLGAQTEASRYTVSADQAKTTAEAIKQNYNSLVQAGRIEDATKFAQGVAARYANEPEVQRALVGMTTGRPTTDLDTAATNVAKFAADQTGIAAGGSQDAQARAFTQESALGRGMTAHQFGDQVQREAGPQDYARFVDIEGGRAANANTLATIAGQERMNNAQIAAQQSQRGATAGGSAAGGPPQTRDERIVDSIDRLIPQVNNWTAGPGSLLSGVPSTDARSFAAELNTLKSNIAFGALQEMREASKTGGALGNVSDRETELLSNTLGGLDQGMEPAALKASLARIRGSVARWEAAKAQYGGGAAGGPQIGATRQAQNGMTLYFDGNGWTDTPPRGSGTSGSW